MNKDLHQLLKQKRYKRNQKLKSLGIVYEESTQTLEESVEEYYQIKKQHNQAP